MQSETHRRARQIHDLGGRPAVDDADDSSAVVPEIVALVWYSAVAARLSASSIFGHELESLLMDSLAQGLISIAAGVSRREWVSGFLGLDATKGTRAGFGK